MKKILSLFLIVCVLLTSAGKKIYADDDPITGVEIAVHDGSTFEEDYGDIYEDWWDGVNIESYNDSSVNVTTGDITATEENGVKIDAQTGGSVTIETGDIDAGYNGVWAETDGVGSEDDPSRVDIKTGNITALYDDGDAVYSEVHGGTIVMELGDLKAGEDGLDLHVDTDGTYIAKTGSMETGENGVYVSEYCGDGIIVVTANGDINAGTNGISIELYNDTTFIAKVDGDITANYVGVKMYSDSLAIASIAGDVSTENVGVYAGGSEDALVATEVQGEVYGKDYGVYSSGSENASLVVNAEEISSDSVGVRVSTLDDSTLDVYSETSISGENVAVAVNSSELQNSENVNIVAWQISINDNGNVAENYDYVDGDFTLLGANEDFEKNNIHYVIKLEQPNEGGSISVTDENGNDLDKYRPINLNPNKDDNTGPLNQQELDIANQDQKVLLKVDLDEGYQVKAAYNGYGEKEELLIDDDGNYYVLVPKGGAVYLSVELEEAPFEYKIIQQQEGDHVIGSGEDYTVTANGDVEKLDDILVDEESAGDGVEVTAGSTIAKLLSNFLDTLTVGIHKLTFKYIDGDVSTNFNIAEKTPVTPDKPDKGDDSSSSGSTDASAIAGKYTSVKTGIEQSVEADNPIYRTISMFLLIGFALVIGRKRH